LGFYFLLLGVLYLTGFYKKNMGDLITFEEDYYTVANPARELKFYWKEVKVCRVSATQIFMNNSNNIFFRISKTGLTEEEWEAINRFIGEKLKLTPLFPYSLFLILSTAMGCIRFYVYLRILFL
jgi:hypothetical protein